MIKIKSIYPFNSFLSVTQEFHEEKVVVKAKSLAFERETEFAYNQVATISDAFYSSIGQMTFGFWLVFIVGMVLIFACNPIYANILLLRIVQGIFFCGVFLFFTGYIKRWHIILEDDGGNALTAIKQTPRNLEEISQITELIIAKSKNVQEISATAPFPDKKPAFEYIYYDYSHLSKTVDRFYEEEMFGFEKGFFYEMAYSVKYDELSGKAIKGAKGINLFGDFIMTLVFVFFVVYDLYRGFDILPQIVFSYTSYAFFGLLAISFLTQFVKRETIELYSNNTKLRYWAFVNRGEKEKVEKIIEFVQSRIPAENKEATRKEQE